MYGWLTFYHQGHEVATDFKPHMLELQARIQKVRFFGLMGATINDLRTGDGVENGPILLNNSTDRLRELRTRKAIQLHVLF